MYTSGIFSKILGGHSPPLPYTISSSALGGEGWLHPTKGAVGVALSTPHMQGWRSPPPQRQIGMELPHYPVCGGGATLHCLPLWEQRVAVGVKMEPPPQGRGGDHHPHRGGQGWSYPTTPFVGVELPSTIFIFGSRGRQWGGYPPPLFFWYNCLCGMVMCILIHMMFLFF